MFGLRGLRPDLEISGFETAFSEIAPRLVERGHRVTIYARAGAHSAARRVPRDSGVEIRYLPSPGGKNFSAVSSTGLAVARALSAQALRRRRHDVWFFVNIGMGHHAALARLSGRPVVMNVDGMDWLRGKWGPVGRAYFRSASRSAVRWCSALVTDAEAMRAYYERELGRPSVMIPYGAHVETSENASLLAPFAVTPREYFLIVSRLIPENSLEVMLQGFNRSATTKPLLVVGGANYDDDFHRRLRAIAAGDERIRLVGQIHDQHTLRELWCNCYAYLHGHSVGGTNPALLRAMGYGSCVLALDTVFNREVLADAGCFFSRDRDSVTRVVDTLDRAPEVAADYRGRAPRRIGDRYSWEGVVDQYEALFMSVTLR
jgi:glycosyltransferase involved in cell wall biosynthesis